MNSLPDVSGETTPPHPSADQGPSKAEPQEDRRVAAARNALRALVRDLYRSRFGHVPADAAEFAVSLKLKCSPHQEWSLSFDPPLTEQILETLDEVEARRAVYEPGRVYCFRCRSSRCEHSLPPGPPFVFGGYSSTGVPTWREFLQFLLELRDSRVEALFADPPGILARYVTGRRLREEQLSSFGRASRTYAILGQVVAGYYRLPAAMRATDSPSFRFAVTFQAVEVRDSGGAMAIRLNVLPGGLSDTTWQEWLVHRANTSVQRGLREAVRRLEGLTGKAQAARATGGAAGMRDVLQAVPAVLHGLARTLERCGRTERRRTRHADERAGERPISKAMEDAREAGPDNLFADEKHSTWVVMGPAGRAHVFTQDGRHVTSLVLQSATVEFRMRTQRWRRMSAEEITRFQAALDATPPPSPDERAGGSSLSGHPPSEA